MVMVICGITYWLIDISNSPEPLSLLICYGYDFGYVRYIILIDFSLTESSTYWLIDISHSLDPLLMVICFSYGYGYGDEW